MTILTKYDTQVSGVSTRGIFSFQLYGIRNSFLKVDTLEFRVSPIELIKFRLHSIEIKNITLYVDSLPFHKTQKKVTSNESKLPNIPIFLEKIQIHNAILITSNHAKNSISNIDIDLKGTTKNFLARIKIENAVIGSFKISFFKANLYRIGNTMRLNDGEFCSDIVCISKIKASYDTLISINTQWVSLKKQDVFAKEIQAKLYPDLKHIWIHTQDVSIHDRNLKYIQIYILKKSTSSFTLDYRITSDWIYAYGKSYLSIKNGMIKHKTIVNELVYSEKNASLKAKLFVKGQNKNVKGIFSIQDFRIQNTYVGDVTCFFKETNFKNLVIDSGFVFKNSSHVYFSGVLTKDSQFIYVEPHINLREYANTMKGQVEGNLACTITQSKKPLITAQLKIHDFSSSFGDMKEASLYAFTPAEDTIMFNINSNGLLFRKIPIDSLMLKGFVSSLNSITFNIYTRLAQGKFSILGKAFKGYNSYTFEIDTLYGKYADTPVLSERTLFASYRKGMLTFTTGNVSVGAGILRFQGMLNKDGTINAMFITKSLDIPNINGMAFNISSITQITGMTDSPTVFSRGEIQSASFKDISIDRMTYSISIVDNFIKIEKLDIRRQEGNLSVNGTVFSGTQLKTFNPDSIHANLSFALDNFDITPLFFYIQDVFNMEEFVLSGNLNVKGTLEKPYFTGAVNLSGKNGYLESVGLRIDRLKGYMQFVGNSIIVKSLRGGSDGGDITAFGTIHSGKYLFDSPDITILTKKVYLEIGPEIQALCDAKLYLKKGSNTPLDIGGNVKVSEGYLFAEFSAPRTMTKEETNPVVGLDLHITWKDNVYLINELAEIEFSGDLSYIYDKSGTLISGRLVSLGGNFSYFEHLFKVTGGDVVFNNLSRINPDLNIQAVTDVDSYSINLSVGGTLTEPLVSLSSEPPLDESNIIALLTFGKLLNQTNISLIGSSFIKEKALGLARSYILRSLRRRLGLRELEVSTGSIEEDPHLTIGFYVTRDIYLKYYHDFLSFQYDRFDLKYRLFPHFGLNATRDEEGQYYFGIFFERRF